MDTSLYSEHDEMDFTPLSYSRHEPISVYPRPILPTLSMSTEQGISSVSVFLQELLSVRSSRVMRREMSHGLPMHLEPQLPVSPEVPVDTSLYSEHDEMDSSHPDSSKQEHLWVSVQQHLLILSKCHEPVVSHDFVCLLELHSEMY